MNNEIDLPYLPLRMDLVTVGKRSQIDDVKCCRLKAVLFLLILTVSLKWRDGK